MGSLRQPELRSRTGAVVAAGVLLLVAGCTVQTSHAPPAGTATLRWSIRGAFDPGDCYAYAAATMQILVYDSDGAYLEDIEASCTAFGTTTALDAGWYSATMQLLDAAGRPVSTLLDTSSFDVHPATDVLIDTDFPDSSFY